MDKLGGTTTVGALRALIIGGTVAAGKDDALPILTMARVRVADGRLSIATTDRYRLAEASAPVDVEAGWQDGTAIVRASVLVQIARRLPTRRDRQSDAVTVLVADDTITVQGVEVWESSQTRTDGTDVSAFPKIEGLWPHEELGAALGVVALSPVYLASLMTAAGKVAGGTNTPVKVFVPAGERRPVLFTLPETGGVSWRALLMPASA